MHGRRRAFTLIELLVVVSIIALLISIVLPAFSSFRVMSKRTVCMANLHSLGQAFEAYLSEYNDYWPYARPMRTVTTEDPNLPLIADILLTGTQGMREVFRCPADRITADPNLLNKTYFQIEGTSYEYDIWNAVSGVKRGRELDPLFVLIEEQLIDDPNLLGYQLSDIPIMNDWECFHGSQGEAKSIVILRADMSIHLDAEPIDRDEWPLSGG